MGYAEGQFPEAEAYASSAISLPLFPGLEIGQQKYVVDQLNSLLDG